MIDHAMQTRSTGMIYSEPGHNDGLIRAWLAWRGWWAPAHIRDGMIAVGDRSRGEYLQRALAETWSDWGNGAPMPTVVWPGVDQ